MKVLLSMLLICGLGCRSKGWMKHFENVRWFFHALSFDSYFKVSFPFWSFLLWMLSQEKSLQWLQAAGAEGLHSDLPLLCPAPEGLRGAFIPFKLKCSSRNTHLSPALLSLGPVVYSAGILVFIPDGIQLLSLPHLFSWLLFKHST